MRLLIGRCALAAAVAAGAGTSVASAANVTFLQFFAESELPSLPQKEFVYDPTGGLSEGPGATGNGTFYAPGLIACITGGLSGVSTTAPPGIGGGPLYNILGDLSLDLTGFNATGAAVVGPGSSFIAQSLGSGFFTLKYTPTNLTLIEGSVVSSTLTEGASQNATLLSGKVTYTGGVLFSQFVSKGLSDSGTFSFAMSGLVGTYGTVNVNGQQRLAAFSADGAGTFDAAPAVPSPAAAWAGMGLLGVLGVMKLRSRRSDR